MALAVKIDNIDLARPQSGLDARPCFRHQLPQALEARLGNEPAGGEFLLAHVSPGGALHFAAGDLDVELVLQLEHEIEEVERLRAQIGHQHRVDRHLRNVARERVGDQLAHPLRNVGHGFSPSSCQRTT